ncbi:MAG: hypothetical protein QG670_662, partial [Thermoproteota archaeon]|nr:hypothetical protein [Thermoproteota archaeon]
MIWKKEKKPELPTETLDQEEYYIANPSELTNLNDVNIKFEGTLSEKPVIEYYATGWPWSISSRIIEEDHGHRTILKVDSINVYCRG